MNLTEKQRKAIVELNYIVNYFTYSIKKSYTDPSEGQLSLNEEKINEMYMTILEGILDKEVETLTTPPYQPITPFYQPITPYYLCPDRIYCNGSDSKEKENK